MFVDELDALVEKKLEVLYTMFDWPVEERRVIIVGVANTMDLPERVLQPRVASRLSTRVAFKSYTREQLQEIVKSRLRASGAGAKRALAASLASMAARCAPDGRSGSMRWISAFA